MNTTEKLLTDVDELVAHFSAGLHKAQRLKKKLESGVKRRKKPPVVSDEELARLDAKMEKTIQKKLKA